MNIQSEELDGEWALEHVDETAQDYVQRMANKALANYLYPAGITPEQEGVRVVVKIKSVP